MRPGTSGLFLFVVALAVGCGGGIPTVPVTGRVTFGGKPPPKDCSLVFLPAPAGTVDSMEGGTPQRTGGGACDPDGEFVAASLPRREGLVPGRYQVRIVCWGKATKEGLFVDDLVPKGFSPPELVVSADARSVRYDVDVPAR